MLLVVINDHGSHHSHATVPKYRNFIYSYDLIVVLCYRKEIRYLHSKGKPEIGILFFFFMFMARLMLKY